jgi:aminopeptidase N
MRTDQATVIQRTDYRPPCHLIDTVHLHFTLDPMATRVQTTLTVRPNPAALHTSAGHDLVLQGEELELESLSVDGIALAAEQWHKDDTCLTVRHLDRPVTLQFVTICRPDTNSTLSGLYTSNGNFYTQCEAQGFRRITYFCDRPDVMSLYKVTIEADAEHYPVLLSNGNLISSRLNSTGLLVAEWEDPFPKPAYLFALVAGKFDQVEKKVNTGSGRQVSLQFYVEPGNADKTDHAMQALVDSVVWDEERFGLELDLDRYMVVAVGDFNMGAMENKGLNIFNTKYVFANPQIATDIDYANIESVIGHEYFHNWTGNRVTCRDWFQLTLKEGLTVFRDQEFSADMLARHASSAAGAQSARAVKRIEDVRTLRMAQFPEDAGPMAHPIRPESYQEINNFYTATVYEKGAEVIRMLQTLVGREGFRRGMDLYFERHDGQAVTCDDFVQAIAQANGRDLGHFMLWDQQAGTPIVSIEEHGNAASATLSLNCSQTNPPVGLELQSKLPKPALLIPISYAFLAHTGEVLQEGVLEFTETKQSFSFSFPAGSQKPVSSLLRGFSAPVIQSFERPLSDLAFLSANDPDAFNRWEASQQLASRAIVASSLGDESVLPLALQAFSATLNAQALDSAFKAEALTLPAEASLGEFFLAQTGQALDPLALRQARERFARLFAKANLQALQATYTAQHALSSGRFQADAHQASARALKRIVLFYWCQAEGADQTTALQAAQSLLASTDNMTDRESAVLAIRSAQAQARDQTFASLEAAMSSEPLAMDKWFQWQGSAPRLAADAPMIERVRVLLAHPAFTWRNPNRVRSLLGAFFNSNPAEFHAQDGSGYALWAETVIELAAINPQIAARMARALDRWTVYTADRRVHMQAALERVAQTANLPTDVLEIVTKALASEPKPKNN